MRILIVEDEQPIAEDIKEMCAHILRGRTVSIRCELTLRNAMHYLAEKQIDLLILDLNLSGRNGFDILREAVSYSFQTIVVSANIDRAIEAFEYGVIDFIPKPYNEERLRKALDRFDNHHAAQYRGVKYLSIRRPGGIRLVDIRDIKYVKGADVYTEIYLRNDGKELHDKTLNELSRLLPENFVRIHKSFIVDVNAIKNLDIQGGGRYAVELGSQEVLPVGRKRYNELKKKLDSLQR
jgi:DNA-binding LytR/AlgR family response regulator